MFIKTNSSWLKFESTKVLEINISMLFNLDFVNNTLLSCFFLFVLFIDLYFLISAVITPISTQIAELAIPIEILTKEAKVEMETNPVIVEIVISECSI